MKRDLLRQFIRRLVAASLPLAAAAGCNDCPKSRSQASTNVYLPNFKPDGGISDGGQLTQSACAYECSLYVGTGNVIKTFGCSFSFDPADPSNGTLTCDVETLDCPGTPCPPWGCPPSTGGRRPAGLRACPHPPANDLGAHFARVAHLEAASVAAFVRLANELAGYDAPAHLVEAARRAARDEQRHARVTRRLAKRYGARPPEVEIDAVPTRTLEEIAIENATEGCVIETYSAVVATWQARAAEDRVVRAAMQRISVDETRHAELAFAVARWAAPRLDARARSRLRAAQQASIRALGKSVDVEVPRALIRQAGIPARAPAVHLVAQMTMQLWA